MNRMQIGLKLGLEVLGIPMSVKNYREICNAVFMAEELGVHISPSRVYFDEREMCAYSPRSHETSNFPSENLLTNIYEMERELNFGDDESKRYELDEKSVRKLEALRDILNLKTVFYT